MTKAYSVRIPDELVIQAEAKGKLSQVVIAALIAYLNPKPVDVIAKTSMPARPVEYVRTVVPVSNDAVGRILQVVPVAANYTPPKHADGCKCYSCNPLEGK